jgi:transcriptional regulator with XRE-family HTH domain
MPISHSCQQQTMTNRQLYEGPGFTGSHTLESLPVKARDILKDRLVALIGDANQAEVADRAGIDQGYVSKLMHGKANTTLDTIDKLAGALGVDSSDLMGLSGQHAKRLTQPVKTSGITEPHFPTQPGEPRAETAVVVRRPSRSPLLIATELQQHVTKLRSHADSISELADSLVRRAPGTKPRPHPHRTPGGSGGASTVHRGTARGRGGK